MTCFRNFQAIDINMNLGANNAIRNADANANKILVSIDITGHAFSRTTPRKMAAFGAAKATTYAIKIPGGFEG